MARGEKVAAALMGARARPRAADCSIDTRSPRGVPGVWWKPRENVGLWVSLLLHFLLCGVLAFVVIERPRESVPDRLQALLERPGDREAQLESVSFADGGDAARGLETVSVASSATTLGDRVTPEVPLPEFVRTDGTGAGTDPGRGSGGAGGGTGSGRRKPAGKNAVTEGSFTVWTIPDDPLPGEDYVIVIEIKLPEKVHRYPRSDLSGHVVGTDGWRQPLPGNGSPLQQYLPIEEHVVQLQVAVPGGGRRVEDTVKVRSRLLKEEQTLKIVF
jgi:hypothetical protein